MTKSKIPKPDRNQSGGTRRQPGSRSGFGELPSNESPRLSEERYRKLLMAVCDVVWDWNLLTGTLWWNDGFLTTFGFEAGKIEPSVESWTGRIHPDESATSWIVR